jgi:XTP/dITP diphosphohydrolase
MSSARLLLASGNPNKLAELRAILAVALDGALELLTPSDVGGLPEVEETGVTFAANAILKAHSGALVSGLACLADDSGLEVDELLGAPGVRSARYAGERANDTKNRAKLLAELAGVPNERRRGRFVCSLALVLPGGRLGGLWNGQVEGRIALAERGQGGFGYDPLFLCEEGPAELRSRTFAELSSAQKAQISHRGRALAEFARDLPSLFGSRQTRPRAQPR